MMTQVPNKHPVSYGRDWFESHFLDNNDAVWDRWLTPFRISQAIRHELCLNLLKGALPGRKALRILDIGCGLGFFTAKLLDLVESAQIIGIDIAERAVKQASRLHPGITFLQRALPDLVFEDDSFDLVTALEVLCYLNQGDRKKAVQEICRAMVPGGYLLFTSHLDDGSFYFTSNEAKTLIANCFEIKRVVYNHARLYSWFEKPFLLASRTLDILANTYNEASQLGVTCAKAILVRASQIVIIRRLATRLAPLIRKPILGILMNRPIARFLFWADKTISGKDRGSHIIILAQKPVNVSATPTG